MELQEYEQLRRTETDVVGIESLRMKQSRFVRLISLLIQFAILNGFEITFADAFAKTGHIDYSLHYIRLALDINLFKHEQYLTARLDYEFLGEYWESLGGSWGGRFGDGCHFSLEHEGRR